MSGGTSIAMALVRVPRGAPAPEEEELRTALARDHSRLRLPAPNGLLEIEVNGPYAITVDGEELDEYVVWER